MRIPGDPRLRPVGDSETLSLEVTGQRSGDGRGAEERAGTCREPARQEDLYGLQCHHTSGACSHPGCDRGHEGSLGQPQQLICGRKAKDIINTARVSLAKMIGGKPQDIIFTSGGTESNNLVIQSMVRCFHKEQSLKGLAVDQSSPEEGTRPHFITCTVEHDSIRLPLEHLMEEQVAEVTFVPVSKVTGQAEVEDVLAAVRPTTCLVTIMLANNETGVIMPVSEISRRVKALNQGRAASGLPRVLVHTDAAQALGKRRVDVEDLGVDFLTIVGHKHSPQLVPKGAQHWPDTRTLHPLLHITGKQRNISTVPGLVLCMYEGSVNLPPCTPCCLEVDKSGISGQAQPTSPQIRIGPDDWFLQWDSELQSRGDSEHVTGIPLSHKCFRALGSLCIAAHHCFLQWGLSRHRKHPIFLL
ncbi:selenocysteine lyase isoform X7 [Meriones unguiculatus]|uniref:selenocysteine lyase isoform X7 n=1 Tax=Meriones unguiculatus TaxID=10047 RepID=UPI00293F583A|nr:selenocysteine lyase isoform X7 [Meriones unguiculatus]